MVLTNNICEYFTLCLSIITYGRRATMEELSVRAKQVFELMKQYSVKNNIKTMGSEYIILAMYETEDSLCHFLLSEYEITKEEIMDKTKDVYILRKENGEYNSSLNTIIKQAKMLSNDNPISLNSCSDNLL